MSMSLAEFKVTNITQGRLELRSYKLTLGPREWVKLAAPIDEEVNWYLGRKFVKIEPAGKSNGPVVQPFTLTQPRSSEKKRRSGSSE